MMKNKSQELLRISARLYGLCAVMDFVAKAANESLYGNIIFHMADSLNRISDDFSVLLDDISVSGNADF